MTYTDGNSGRSRSDKVTKSVAEFFDANGTLCVDRFEPEVRMLQNRIATSKRE